MFRRIYLDNSATTRQITRSGNIVIKGITESNAINNLTLSANLGNAPSKSFSVAAVKIKRTVAGQTDPTDVTDTTMTTIVGQRINLMASIQPSGINPSSQKWTVPETIVKDFQVSEDRKKGEKVPVDPLNTANTSFVWVDGGGASKEDFVSKEVKYEALIDGQTLMGKSTFQVKRPVFTLQAETSATNLLPFEPNGKILIYGNGSNIAGITFKNTESPQFPNGFQGTMRWVQIVNSSVRKR